MASAQGLLAGWQAARQLAKLYINYKYTRTRG